MTVKAPRGTADLLPDEARAWAQMREVAARIFSTYGYVPIETPIFEMTDMFDRGIGESTDVVRKEMFSVLSMAAADKLASGVPLKADQKLSLRPEGTASVVRAVQEHGLIPQGGAPVKYWYAGPMFRCERPQKGRLRQFHQIGVECLGAPDAAVDAEVIIMLMRFFAELGIPSSSMRLLINSMGDDCCRPAYRQSVADFIGAHADELCEECVRRADTNPLRAFDCKNPECQAIMAQAPTIDDALCERCRAHYEEVKSYLDIAGVSFIEDPRLVRGLDYYTSTVFEVQVIEGMGVQNAIGGGGRYDKLMETVGGKPTPGLGFAVGFERIMLALEAAGVSLGRGDGLDVFVAAVDDSVARIVFSVAQELRDAGIVCDSDHQGRSLKSQLKLADKEAASIVIICGPEEAASGEVTMRDMNTHDEKRVDVAQVVSEVQSLLAK